MSEENKFNGLGQSVKTWLYWRLVEQLLEQLHWQLDEQLRWQLEVWFDVGLYEQLKGMINKN